MKDTVNLPEATSNWYQNVASTVDRPVEEIPEDTLPKVPDIISSAALESS